MEDAAAVRRLDVWAGLGTIYVVWGSTFIAVAYTVRTLPPLLAMSARHLLAGSLLLAWAYRRGRPWAGRPTRRQWAAAFVVGGALFLGGHGGLAWAQQHVPAGVAALLVGTIPLWMALIERLGYGIRLGRRAVVGLVVGFAGLVLLVGGPGEGRVDLLGAVVILAGAVSWAAGSLYSRSASLPAQPLVAAGMGALAGGVLLALAGTARGELGDLSASTVSRESLLGLAYLVVVGSILGFTVYVWLLRVAPSSLVSTYAYANPVVAIVLGWALLDEAITTRMLLAAVAIIASVALIVAARAPGEGEPGSGVESRDSPVPDDPLSTDGTTNAAPHPPRSRPLHGGGRAARRTARR